MSLLPSDKTKLLQPSSMSRALRSKRGHDQVEAAPSVFRGVVATLAKKKAYAKYSKFFGSIDAREGPGLLAYDTNIRSGLIRVGKWSLGPVPQEHLDLEPYKATVERKVQDALEGTFFDEQRIKAVFADAIETTLGGGMTVNARIIQKIGILGSMSAHKKEDGNHYAAAEPQMVTVTQASRVLRPIPQYVLQRIPAVRLRLRAALQPGVQITMPAGYEPFWNPSSSLAIPAGFDEIPSVLVLVNAAAKAFDGESRDNIEKWMSEVLNPEDFYAFSPKVKLGFIAQHQHYVVWLAGTGGEQRRITFRMHEQDRLQAFWDDISKSCNRSWPLDWQVADDMLAKAWDQAKEMAPAEGSKKLVLAHSSVCTLNTGQKRCTEGVHTCPSCRNDFSCQEFEGVCCFTCAIRNVARKRHYQSKAPVSFDRDEDRRVRMGLAASEVAHARQSQIFIGFPFVETAASEDRSVDWIIVGVEALLNLKQPPELLCWPRDVVRAILSKLLQIEFKRDRWMALRDMLSAFCKSQDLPCKWRLDEPGQPIFHHEVALDECSWWYNFVKKGRSPLTIILFVGAAIVKHSESDSKTDAIETILCKVHHIDQAWSSGSGPSAELADSFRKAMYGDLSLDVKGLVSRLKTLDDASVLRPLEFKRPNLDLEKARALDLMVRDPEHRSLAGQMLELVRAEKTLRFEELHREAQNPSDRSMRYVPLIVKLFEALESNGHIDKTHRLAAGSAFPGLFWAGKADVHRRDIIAFTLRLTDRFILQCDWTKTLCRETLRIGCFRCLLVGMLVNLALHPCTDHLTGLPICPCEPHCPLNISLGHADHAYPGALISLHNPVLHKDADFSSAAVQDVVQSTSTEQLNVRLEAWLSNSLIKSWRTDTIETMLETSRPIIDKWFKRMGLHIDLTQPAKLSVADFGENRSRLSHVADTLGAALRIEDDGEEEP